MRRALSIGALVIMVGLVGSVPASAATIGPDAFGYTASEVHLLTGDISGIGTQVLPNVDDAFAQVPIGFDFNFYGTAYTDAFVSTNGLITFGSGNAAFTNTNLTASPTQASIAVLFDDWTTTGGADAVYYLTSGIAGHQQFVVQWNNVGSFGGPADNFVTFQAILFESNGDIYINYFDTLSGDGRDNGGSSTVGIKDVGAQGGNRLLWSFNQNVIGGGTALRFQRPDAQAPEPGTLALLALGMAGAAYRRRRG
jgi:hypothetical protein